MLSYVRGVPTRTCHFRYENMPKPPWNSDAGTCQNDLGTNCVFISRVIEEFDPGLFWAQVKNENESSWFIQLSGCA